MQDRREYNRAQKARRRAHARLVENLGADAEFARTFADILAPEIADRIGSALSATVRAEIASALVVAADPPGPVPQGSYQSPVGDDGSPRPEIVSASADNDNADTNGNADTLNELPSAEERARAHVEIPRILDDMRERKDLT
jgi:hypothetical protein